MKIKKGDNVVVISGKNKGKTGKVLFALPKQQRIVVDKINIQKRHTRARRENEKGQVISLPMPFAVSNVKLLCGGCNKATRVAYTIEGKDKLRVCVKCKKQV